MTLITTIISNFGLIQASDSNVTRADSSQATTDPKVFPLATLPAALALAGTYRVGSERMDTWMPRCISSYEEEEEPTVEGFAYYLKERLDHELTEGQALMPTLIHVVGYVSDGDGSHPVMYFVRNVERINEETGAYEGISRTFHVREDFWRRDHPAGQLRGLHPDRYQTYFNGTPDGRIAFVHFANVFRSFLDEVWQYPTWKFRRPKSLDDLATIADLQIRAIGALYVVSDYEVPSIGGEPQICKIPAPPDAVGIWSGSAKRKVRPPSTEQHRSSSP